MLRRVISCTMVLTAASVWAVPIPSEKKDDIVDRTNFIPHRKHLPVPGKIIALLATDAQPVLSMEGRSGPPDQLCVGWNGGSYRWVYVPVENNAVITNLSVPLPGDKTKVYPKLNMANPTTVKAWGIDAPYTLVEVEVNDGAGSPTNDSFVATRMSKLDGSKQFPIQVAAVIADLKKQYQTHLSEKQKDLDAAMEDAAKKTIKDRKPTGPRESQTVMFATWIAESEKLQVRFFTRITDGDYKYGNGINIELRPPAPPLPDAKGGALPPDRLENGLRYGTQFGIEYGAQFEVSKDGKVSTMKTLEVQSFQKELPPPPVFDRKRPMGIPVPKLKN